MGSNVSHSPEQRKAIRNYIIFFIALFFVSVLLGIISISQDQAKKHDIKLVSKISRISSDISRIQDKRGVYALPDDISSLTSEPLDGIQYKKLDATSYQICADFKTDKIGSSSSVSTGRINPRNHKKGNDCFETTVKFKNSSPSSKSTKTGGSTSTPQDDYYYDTSTLSHDPATGGLSSPADATCGVKPENLYTGKAGTIDTTQKRIYQEGAAVSSTNFVRYDEKTKFVDRNCRIISVASIKKGDLILFVTSLRNSHQFADLIRLQ